MRLLLLIFATTVSLIHGAEYQKSQNVVISHLEAREGLAPSPGGEHSCHVLSIPRGGGFAWTAVPSPGTLAKAYVGFTAANGFAMAVLPTIAASLYGSAFDDSKESMLAILLLERQGDAVLGTSILLYLSSFTQVPIAKSVAWSTVPYVLSLVKFICLGQATALSFDNRVAMAMMASLALPTLNIFTAGPHMTVAASALATALLAYGSFGSINAIQSASVEGLDITASPGWIGACWSLASLCVLQHAILSFRVLWLNDNVTIYNIIGFAAFLNVVLAAYVGFLSGIPESVEIPKIGFVVWMLIGLVVGFGITLGE